MLALIPLALSLAPPIANWLFGASAAKTTAAVASAAAAITGTTDTAAQMRALEDPAQASAFGVELAKIAAGLAAEQRANELAELTVHLADTASARGTMVALAQGGSSMSWGAPVVSFLVLATFAAVLTLAFTHAVPPDAGPILNVMLGTLTAMATAVVSFWVGSSAGSKGKDETIAQQSRALATSP